MNRPGLADLGLRLAEAKQLTAALQAEMVPRAQVTMVGEHVAARAWCVGASWPARVITPHDVPLPCSATCRSGFGACSPVPAKSSEAGQRASPSSTSMAATVAPELAYVTARYAALAPFRQAVAGPAVRIASDLRSTEREARCGTGRCGSAKTLCSRTPPRRGRADHGAGSGARRGWV